MDDTILRFFVAMPDALPLYEAFAGRLLAAFPDTRVTVHKTQITFANRYGFAFVSLPIRRVKGWPKVCIIVTFGLGRREDDPRIMQAVEPYPGRWTHHVIVEDAAQVDDQLMGWIAEAYAFSATKGRRK